MTMQHRQSAAAPLWERVVADPRLLLRLISFDRGRRSSAGVSIPTVPIYLRCFCGAPAAHPPQRNRRRRTHRAGEPGRGRPVVAARQRTHSARRCDSRGLLAAIEENFGSGHHVEVGGTQIEHTESGGTAVRIRDIVVRDADGAVVASAPKAEVRVSSLSLLRGHVRAESLNLVGAEMAVRIEQDGGVTIFAGADKHPIATAAVPAAAATRSGRNEPEKMAQAAAAALRAAAPATVPSAEKLPPPRRASEMFAGLLSRIDAIGESGLDGHESARARPQEREPDRQRRAHRQALDVPRYQPQRRAGARRRRRGHHRLGQCRAAVGADGVDRADRQRLPQDRSRGAPRRGERSPFGLALRRRKRAVRYAALGEHCRPGRARRRAGLVVRPHRRRGRLDRRRQRGGRSPCGSTTPNSGSIGMPQAAY